MTVISIGIGDNGRKQVAEVLGKLLASSYTLYLKTHNYHWNVEGPMFHTLHLMFEEQYTELSAAVDQIAERIRALGFKAPGSYSEFSALSAVEEGKSSTEAMQMVRNLAADHETIARTSRESLRVAEEAGDDASVDLFTQRMQVHEKTAWMLRSMAA